MKAYLINPFNRTVVETVIADEGEQHMNDIYNALNCSLMEVGAYIGDGLDCVLVDEEGLLGNLNEQRFFLLKVDGEITVTLAGMGLIVGTDQQGKTVEPQITLEELEKLVRFTTIEEVVEQQAE